MIGRHARQALDVNWCRQHQARDDGALFLDGMFD